MSQKQARSKMEFQESSPSSSFSLCSFNIRGGLQYEDRQAQLMNDAKRYKLDVMCLQETRGPDININYKDFSIYSFGGTHSNYGLGFLIHARHRDNIVNLRCISSRITTLTMNLEVGRKQRRQLTIINAYAPAMNQRLRKPSDYNDFYKDLQNTYNTHCNNSLLLLVGDFNSHVGKQQCGEQFMGAYSVGSRNANGQRLINFLTDNNLYINSTHFQHPSRHITTWSGLTQNKTPLHTQIDYIISPYHLKSIFRNCRSYNGAITNSDHSILVGRLFLDRINNLQHYRHNNSRRENIWRRVLENDQEERRLYAERVKHEIQLLGHNSVTWPRLLSILHKARNKIKINTSTATHCYFSRYPLRSRCPDPELQQLSKQQQTLRLLIYNTPQTHGPGAYLQTLVHQRSQILRQIRMRLRNLRSAELDSIAAELESHAGDNRRCFAAARKLFGTKYQSITLHHNSCNLVTPQELLPIITAHYIEYFSPYPETHSRSHGTATLQQLAVPISIEEVHTAIKSLKHRKCIDMEGTYSEMLQYNTDSLLAPLSKSLNEMLTTGKGRQSLHSGILIPINKPNKPKTLDNIRPIIIVNAIRKVLSTIVLRRIYLKADSYINPNQSAYRRGRSTADILWSYRWLDGMAQRYENLSIRILGIDLSKAFDSVDRGKLLGVLRDNEIADTDELQMIEILLECIQLRVRVGGQYGEIFESWRGILQGDGLSPVLFAIYLEAVLREVKHYIRTHGHYIMETAYADDVDFISETEDVLLLIQQEAPHILAKWKLRVNLDKTERYTLHHGAECNIRKLGCFISSTKEVEHRCNLANAAFNTKWRLWLRSNIVRKSVRTRLYNALILPMFTYNIGTIATTESTFKRMDVTHRKHLRGLLRIHYPNRISNTKLYTLCNAAPISHTARRQRWRLFGHILRLSPYALPRLIMINYYRIQHTKYYKGLKGAKLTLPRLLQRELQYIGMKLTSEGDLNTLTLLAHDRGKWHTMIEQINTASQLNSVSLGNSASIGTKRKLKKGQRDPVKKRKVSKHASIPSSSYNVDTRTKRKIDEAHEQGKEEAEEMATKRMKVTQGRSKDKTKTKTRSTERKTKK